MAPGSSLTSQSTPISEGFARFALAVERYILPWIYVWFAYRQLRMVHENYLEYRVLIHHGVPHMSWPLFCAGVTKNVLMSCLSVFIALTLFISRRPAHLPKNLAQITVPLAMSFYFFLYPAVILLPPELRTNLLPQQWGVPAAAVAVFLSAIGYGVAIWGLVYLRRSFALLVAVREVVSGGPYRYVRHPMYLGYLIEATGLILSSLSLGMLILGFGFVLLTITRAQLEEERLAEACPAYREYMQRTGFILPRRRNAKPATIV